MAGISVLGLCRGSCHPGGAGALDGPLDQRDRFEDVCRGGGAGGFGVAGFDRGDDGRVLAVAAGDAVGEGGNGRG